MAEGYDCGVRRVAAVRYVTPLREGGSLPAVVEGDDGGLWVVKFRGAGQGPRALVAEWIVGEIGRRAGLAVPEIVGVELPAELARTEPDPEIQDLLRASVGLNLALRYLPGSLMFDPAADPVDGTLAARIVALDAWTVNVDRTARNPNLLWWQDGLWLIDHGAALYWQHAWQGDALLAPPRFARILDHVLLGRARGHLEAAAAAVALDDDALGAIVDSVPDDWLTPLPSAPSPEAQRAVYAAWLRSRRDLLAADLGEVDHGR
jgi:hypothetical protein